MVFIKRKKSESAEELEKQAHEKELQQMGIQDDFQARGFELVNFAQEHSKTITVLVASFLIGGAIYVANGYYSRTSDEKAGKAFVTALSKFTEENDAKAEEEGLKQLESFLNEYSGAKVSNLAQLFVAHEYLKKGKAAEAVNAYKAFLNRTGMKHELRALALTGLAYAYAEKGDKKEALATFEDLLSGEWDIYREYAMWEVARLAKDLNMHDKAKDYAQKFLDKYPESSMASKAKKMLNSDSSVAKS